MSIDDMLDGGLGYEENPVYALRKRAGGPDTEHFARSKNNRFKTINHNKMLF